MSDQMQVAAIKLAIKFSEESDIPLRFKEIKQKEVRSKMNFDTMIEKKFQNKVNAWKITISNILKVIEGDKAWRLINLNPSKQLGINSSAYHQDFIDFTDYFILRRDIKNCEFDELGCLADLHTAFQREIEKSL